MTKKTLILITAIILLMQLFLFHEQKLEAKDHGLLMEGVDGKQHNLQEYIGKGKWVVVNVWATACPYCRRELFDLASFHEKHAENDAVVLGLTLDLATFGKPDIKHVKAFASTYLIEYPLLLVSGETASEVTGKNIHTVPMTFFYNPKGEMVYHFTGEMDEAMFESVIKGQLPR